MLAPDVFEIIISRQSSELRHDTAVATVKTSSVS